MIVYNKRKYSLPVHYIGKTVNIKEENSKLNIFYQNQLVTSFDLSEKKFNYKIEHMTEILRSDVMKYKDAGEIEEFARRQLQLYDSL